MIYLNQSRLKWEVGGATFYHECRPNYWKIRGRKHYGTKLGRRAAFISFNSIFKDELLKKADALRFY